MKTRNGFVSNSSSSSFVVAVNPNKSKIKMTIEFDLKDYARDVIKTVEELDRYFKDEYGHDEIFDDYVMEEYRKCSKAIADGKHVLFGSFSSKGGESKEAFLCENGIKVDKDDKDVEVIQSEAGY